MQSKWKKAFVAAAIFIAIGAALMSASLVGVKGDFTQLRSSIVFDEQGLVMPDAPAAPAAPSAPAIPSAPKF